MKPKPPRPPLVAVAAPSRASAPARSLPLIALIGRASVEPDIWNQFVSALSVELDDAAIGMGLELPRAGRSLFSYGAQMSSGFREAVVRFSSEGRLPWPFERASTETFTDFAEFVPNLRAADFYRECMEPLGLAPEPPIAHIFARENGRMLAHVAIYRRVGRRPFTSEDIAFLDLLVPYLSQAYHLHAMLLGYAHREGAYQDVIDRFPTGVVMIDPAGSVVASNRAAERIAALDDGFSLADGRVRATIASSDVVLQRAIREVLEASTDTDFGEDQGFTLMRPSGRRPFSVMISYVLAPTDIGLIQDAVAAVYIADPEFQQLGMRSLLGSFHGLTAAELELAALICEGETIESAARARGVSQHTARSQLRRIFVKTGTRRQADLVGLVTGGLAKLHRADAGDEDEA